MEAQELLVTQPKPTPVLSVVVVLITLALAGYNAWSFAIDGAWLYMAAAGLAPPLVGLIEWARLRRRSEDARVVADRLIWIVLFAAAVVTL